MNKLEKTQKDRILEILRTNDFIDTDEATDLLDESGFWDSRDPDDLIRAQKKSETRLFLKTLKDEEGEPAFANIEIETLDGKVKHVYMQPYLFDVEQFKQIINYHTSKARHHADRARKLQKQLQAKYNIQYELPFKLE